MDRTDDTVVVHVVDDDPAVRDSVAFLLDSVGIPTRTHADPESFLAELDPAEPAVVLLDVRMPGLSGLQVQERLADLGCPAPVVFCSAHGDVPLSVRAMRAGAADFLEKPSDPQRLIEVVQEQTASARTRYADADVRRGLTARLASLTPREREVLGFAALGWSSRQIATELGTSVKTIDVHRANIKAKTGADSITQFVGELLRAGIEA